MIENLNIIGSWDTYVETPFGFTKATALIKGVSPSVFGTINGENGSIDFDNGTIVDNILTFSATVDTPIKATITVKATFEEDSFLGNLMIDDYLKVLIKGTKNVNI
jgi:hypothetical protein